MTPLARQGKPQLDDALSGGLGIPEGEADAQLERALYADARGFVARPGKAFRARLIEASFALAGGSEPLPTAALEAVELLHCGSLIVDDIQDDSESRRGAPALHRLIGTPRALNTGNWLYFVALSRLDELPLDCARAYALSREAHRCLVRCHEGQALDLALRVSEVRRAEVAPLTRTIAGLKTGALAGFSSRLGATLAAADAAVIDKLTEFGTRIGRALQMLDDLGSLTCEARHHKALEDLRGQRVGWGWAWAAEVLDEVTFKQLIKLLAREGDLPALRARLAEVVEPLGRMRIRAALDEAERDLAAMFAKSHALELLHGELVRLERSYG